MASVILTELRTAAKTMNGVSVAVLPAASYRRICSNVVLGIDGISGAAPISVGVYVGSLNDQPIATNFVGQTNRLRGRFAIPAGQMAFVAWSAVSTNGFATFTVQESESTDPTDQILTWENASQTPISVPETTEFQSFTNTININAGSSFFTSSVFDMRRYNSLSIVLNLVTQNVATAYNPVYVGFAWRLGPTPADPMIFEDIYGVYADSKGGAFLSQYGRFEYEDQVRGPYLSITCFFANGASADTVLGSLLVYGNGRVTSGPAVRNPTSQGTTAGTGLGINADNSQLYAGHDVVAGGATKTILLPCAPGPAGVWFTWFNTQINYQLMDFQGNVFFDALPAVAGARVNALLALPKIAPRLNLANVGGANGDSFSGLVSGRGSWY